MCIGRTAPALAGTQPSAPNLPKEARAQPPLSFLAASFFSLKLKKSVEVHTMKFLLALGSKDATCFRSVGLALMTSIVAMRLATGAQAQYYKYTALDRFTGLQKRFFRTQW